MNPKARRWILCALFLAGLVCIPIVTNNYYQYIVNLIFVNFLVALGLAVTLGYCGQFAFASAGFSGDRCLYGRIIDRPFRDALLGGVDPCCGVSLVFAVFLGFIGLRLSRYYLAISTMAFTLAMRFFYVNAKAVTFGPSGFNIPPPTPAGFAFNTDRRLYYIVLAVVVILAFLTRNVLRSKIGRAFIAIRDNEDVAAAGAISVRQYKMLALAMGGILGGVAGGLYSVVLGRITPDEFGMGAILLHFLIVVLGGLGTFLGLMISSVLITILPEVLRAFVEFQEIVYGGVIILISSSGPMAYTG